MANEYKTLPVGTKFTYEGNTYQVYKYYNSSIYSCCNLCAFCNINCDKNKSIRGECFTNLRSDNFNVYFKLIEDNTNKDMDKVNTIIPIFDTDNSLNDLHVDCPKGYSIDVNNSDLSKGVIKFKKDNITLGDIYENQGRDTFVTNVVVNNKSTYNKILAIAQLMDIASYYNVNWKPDWNNNEEHKYSIGYGKRINQYTVNCSNLYRDNFISFKNKSDAQDVIDNPNFREILNAIYKD